MGGKNTHSAVVVRNLVGWNAADRIWLSSVAKVVMPTAHRTIVPLDVALARHQLTAAMLDGREVANAVGASRTEPRSSVTNLPTSRRGHGTNAPVPHCVLRD